MKRWHMKLDSTASRIAFGTRRRSWRDMRTRGSRLLIRKRTRAFCRDDSLHQRALGETLVGNTRFARHEQLAFATSITRFEANLRLLHVNPARLVIFATLERKRVNRTALRAGTATCAVRKGVIAVRTRRRLELGCRDDAAETPRLPRARSGAGRRFGQ